MVHLSSSNHWRSMHVRPRLCLSSLYLFTGVLFVQHEDLSCLSCILWPFRSSGKSQCMPSCYLKPPWWSFIPDSYNTRLSKSPQASILGFLVPYFERAVTRLPTPPYTTIISTQSTSQTPPTQVKTHQIKSPSNQMILHTRTILTSASTHQHNRMLLHIVSYAKTVRTSLPNTRSPNHPQPRRTTYLHQEYKP